MSADEGARRRHRGLRPGRGRPLLLALGLLVLVVGVATALALVRDAPVVPTASQEYPVSDEALANPGRGFYHYTEARYLDDGSGYVPLDRDELVRWRTEEGVTLVFRVQYLHGFVDQDDIDPAYLALLAADLDTAREAGVKLVLRFAYTDTSSADAPPERVLAHIAQLAPVLDAGADVIAVLQAGFVGRWGEWYYSDGFASDPDHPGDLDADDRAAREAVLEALLDEVDPAVPVQVRYPGIKQALFAADDASPRARRVGVHNDCFLADDEDSGTFVRASDRRWLEVQTRTVLMGGETCAVNPPRSQWPTASAELARYHWTFLNADFHPEVLSSWGEDGLAEAGRRLGYRLSLVSAELPTASLPGQEVPVRLVVRNDGYAALGPGRPVLLAMVGEGGTRTAPLPVDLSEVGPGESVAFTATATAPTALGDYALELALPDPAAALAERPEYAVRLANEGTWDPATARNDLRQSMRVRDPAEEAGVTP